jgi:hypothetical protein
VTFDGLGFQLVVAPADIGLWYQTRESEARIILGDWSNGVMEFVAVDSAFLSREAGRLRGFAA